MTDNFVDIVGFQLEKVHTGVIAWLLDSAAKTLPARERSVVLCALSGIDVGSADQVLTHAEYGQRSKHVDLVVELRCTTQGSKWLVLELKTDSDVDIRQLKASHDFVQRHAPRDKVVPITLALGAAQATIPYAGEKDAPDFKFRAFDADETCSLVKSLSIAGRSHVFDSWVGALAAEQERFTKVE